MPSMARIVSLTILSALIVFLGLTFYQVLTPFLLPLFLAGVVAILCQPIFQYFCKRTKGRIRIAAGLTTASVVSAVFIPLLVGIFLGAVQLYTFASHNVFGSNWNEIGQNIQNQLDIEEWIDRFDRYLPEEFDAEQAREEIQKALKSVAEKTLGNAGQTVGVTVGATLGVLGAFASFLISLTMFLIALYYFLSDGPNLIKASEGLIPVHVNYQRELLGQFTRVVRSVVMATFLAAIAQGIATAIALKIVGFDHFFLFLMVCTVAAMIPLAGTWLVWGPCALWLAFNGHWVSAIGLAIWGGVVVGTLDNVIRTYILQNDTKLHPLLAFISVLGGLQVMGLWGVFIGPIVASCLHALIQIFNTELFELSKEKFGIDDDDNASDESDGEASGEKKQVAKENGTSKSDVEGQADTNQESERKPQDIQRDDSNSDNSENGNDSKSQ